MKLLISAVTWDAALKDGMAQADLADLAVEFGCHGVELRQYWRNIAVEVPATAAALASRNLACAYACNAGLLADSRQNTMDMLATAGDDLSAAAGLGAAILRLNLAAGPFDPAIIAAPWWRQAVGRLLERAEGLGIPIAIENGPDPARSDVALFADLFGRVASPWLRLTFDTGNWLFAGVAPEAALERLLPHIGYVHLKDIIVGPGGRIHSHPGTGVVDIRGLVRRLTAAGYDGFLALEFPGGDDPAGRVRASLAHLAG